MSAARLLRQGLQQHAKNSTLSCLATGLPGHLLQANLTSLQARHFCRLAHLNEDTAWRNQTASHRQLLAAPARHVRGFAEQASQDKAINLERNSKAEKAPKAAAGTKEHPRLQLQGGAAANMKSGMIKAVFLSPNVLMEPYRGPGVPLPFVQSWFTFPGWRARKERVMSNLKSMYAIAKLKKNIKGFGLRKFKGEALQVYEETCQLLAEGDLSRLRQATTPALFGDMKREIKARQDGGWKSVRWSMVKRPELKQLDILHGRIMASNPKDDKTAWVQLTVQIPSEQSFAVYNAKKSLVAGSPDTAMKVKDTWVFERALKQSPSTRWRCAGRLSILPPSTAINAADTKLAAAEPSVQQRTTPKAKPVVVLPKTAQPRKHQIRAAAAAI